MTALTVLGATGGCGATTLVALTALGLMQQTSRMPTVVAEDLTAFDRRLGERPLGSRRSQHELIDAGRFATGKATSALRQGYLALVGASTVHGRESLARAVSELSVRLPDEELARLTLVSCASFGTPPRTLDHTLSVDVDLPFDSNLASSMSVSRALPLLRGPTRKSVNDNWLPIVRTVLA